MTYQFNLKSGNQTMMMVRKWKAFSGEERGAALKAKKATKFEGLTVAFKYTFYPSGRVDVEIREQV